MTIKSIISNIDIKLSDISNISLYPISNGAISGDEFKSSDIWSNEPALIFVARRPGCPLCREHAIGLNNRLESGEIPNIKFVSIIKEIAPSKLSNVKTDEELGVSVYQSVYMKNKPVYLDESQGFYKAFGSQSLLSQKWSSWNPITIYKDYNSMVNRLKEKNVTGNLVGEGLVKGGVLIVSKDQGVIYAYDEITGSDLPYDEIKSAIANLSK
eukprot:gene20928-27126_t